jgi:hypothetical protein
MIQFSYCLYWLSRILAGRFIFGYLLKTTIFMMKYQPQLNTKAHNPHEGAYFVSSSCITAQPTAQALYVSQFLKSLAKSPCV